MKIAIYETVHLDLVIPYADLLAEEDLDISFITSGFFKKDLENILAQKNCPFTWHFIDPGETIFKFTKKIRSVFKNNHYDVVILNSIDSRHLIIFMILALSKPGRVLINLHDINNFFKIKPLLSIRANIRAAGKKLLMRLTDGFIVNAEAMKEYMLKNNLTSKPLYWLQPVYYKALTEKRIAVEDTIVIPGTIDKRRRDYRLALEVIQEMLNRDVIVTWIFAGQPSEDYGTEIIDKAKKLNARGAKIIFYKEEIPDSEFQQIIGGCTLIFSPLLPLTSIHDDINEVYGETKASGNVYDVIRHAKPFIVPFTFIVPKEIETSCVVYKSKNDLIEQLFKILNDTQLLSAYIQKAKENAKNFSKERIKNMFMAAIQKSPLEAAL